VYAVEPEPMDTAGAIRFAAVHAGITETFVVVNGDVLTDLDLTALVDFHRARGAEGTIALHPVKDPSAFGVVPTDELGRVTAFVEKPPRDEAPTNQINAGTYVLEPSVLDRIPAGRRVSVERETFPAMVKDQTLFARSDDAYWLDTGTAAAYLQANRDLVAGRRGRPPCPGAELVDGQWVRGAPVVAGRMVGPCFIDDGVVVADGAVVERSVLEVGSVVESGAVVSESVLMAGSRVTSGSRVADSVLGPRSVVGERCDVRSISVLGAGAVVASGSRLDGERVPG
jgi:NDP-sugar pyrophosphorylase family protein